MHIDYISLPRCLASPQPGGHRQGGQGPDPPDAGAAAEAQHVDHAPQG